MILLLDIGNTRLKYSFWSQNDGAVGQLTEQVAIVHNNHIMEVLGNALLKDKNQQTDISRVLVSNVAGKVIEQDVISACQRFLNLQPEFAQTRKNYKGLVIAYDQAEKLGVDRWLALLAAQKLPGFEKTPVCVVDSGSALTIDVVSAQCEHMGGFIIPGISLMYNSLLSGTREVQADRPLFQSSDWGQDTTQAVSNGAVFATVATIEKARCTFNLQLSALQGEQAEPVQVILTGGDADIILPHLKTDIGAKIIPDLVIRGLLVCFSA